MESSSLLILSPRKSVRLEYTSGVLCKLLLGAELSITTREDFFNEYTGPKISYGVKRPDAISIFSSGLLFEQDIRDFVPQKGVSFNAFTLFPAEIEGFDLDFDIFSAVFYLITRYEEYLGYEADHHGRFPADKSILVREKVIELPLCHCWADMLAKKLNARYRGLNFRLPAYQLRLSYDIDLPYAYRAKSLFRTLGGLFNSGEGKVFERVQVLAGLKTDPYDVYDWLNRTHKSLNLSAIYFFIVGKHGQFDKNPSAGNTLFKKLIRRHAEEYEIGIHPSYASMLNVKRLSREKRILENIVNNKIVSSRQHYLRLKLPESYQLLNEVGIQHDYTMGYSTTPGFRAGINIPYPFFDLSRNEVTSLWIHPFAIMDACFRYIEKIDPEELNDRLQSLIKSVKKYGGELMILSHNNTFERRDQGLRWRKAYEQLLQSATA